MIRYALTCACGHGFDAWFGSIAGFDEASREDLARRLARLGASRVCPAGAMQAPPISWCHDGQGVLTPLARFSDLDSD